MSFFGVTQMGVQNSFKSGLVNALGFSVFSVDEFEAAFQKLDKDGSGYITPDEVEDLLFTTYGFPPMEEEVELFMSEFDINADGKVSWEEFKLSMERIKTKMDKKAEGAKEYQSFEELKSDLAKHRRPKVEVQEKYKAPMTFNQSVGFKVNDKIEKEIMKMDTYPNVK
mmetsp:Transcript_23127/g.20522  ORF Transcript_23127/g.20522 Transcript_23127/m.20522 type:complete len:168 (+) Transcript_23127:16-519(+)